MDILERKSSTRGSFKNSWLDTKYTFSFGNYTDDNWVKFGSLRVINDDKISTGGGFGMHSHKNMEIITYLISGKSVHIDNMGNEQELIAGDIQYMCAGTGVMHDEFIPPENEEPVHLLQIWIFPNKLNYKPKYELKHYTKQDKLNKLLLMLSLNGDNNSIAINQNVNIYSSVLDANKKVILNVNKANKVWVQLISGRITINSKEYMVGDGIGILNAEEDIIFEGLDDTSEFLVFNMQEG